MKSVILIAFGLMSFSAFAQEETQITLTKGKVDTLITIDQTIIGSYGGKLLKSTEIDSIWNILAEDRYSVKFLTQIDSVNFLFIDHNTNFTYNSHTDSIKRYTYKNPIREFLKHDFAQAVFSSKYICHYCPGSYINIHFDKSRDSLTSNSERRWQGYYYNNEDTSSVINKKNFIDIDEWQQHLLSIDSNPYSFPEVKVFQLDSLDKFIYYERLRILRHSDSYFKYKLPELLDTLSQESLEYLLTNYKGYFGSDVGDYRLQIVNLQGDTLELNYNIKYQKRHSYEIPIHIEFNGKSFYTYSTDLSLIFRKLYMSYYYYNSHTKEEFLDYIGSYYYPNKYDAFWWHH